MAVNNNMLGELCFFRPIPFVRLMRVGLTICMYSTSPDCSLYYTLLRLHIIYRSDYCSVSLRISGAGFMNRRSSGKLTYRL